MQRIHRRLLGTLAALAFPSVAGATPVPAAVAEAPAPPAEPRWTDATPDRMIDDARARALGAPAKPAPEPDVLAAALTIDELADRALYGHAEKALEDIAHTVPGDVAIDAALLARGLAADEGTKAGTLADAKLGVLTQVSILGPFRDTGGGLDVHDGPEGKAGSFADPAPRYSWGTVDVAWRPVPDDYATAEGVPLDLLIHPRKESCTWVASRVTVAAEGPLTASLASTGSARLVVDGVTVAKSDDVHASAKLDRIAVRLRLGAGPHLVAAKSCTGALDDDGRVRLRVTADPGAPAPTASADLRTVPSLAAAPASWKLQRLETPLSRTLAATSRGRDVQLDAAVARTLGGADDLKSPRAPGLLDAVTSSATLDADRLAMTGWIAPSGANRSGWLSRALDRAVATGDLRAKAFVERRLVAQRASGRMPDWAIATARGAQIGTLDPEAVLIHAVLDEALGVEALRASAMRALSQAMDASPETVPSALLLELAPLATEFDPGRNLAVRSLLAKRGEGATELARASVALGRDAVVKAAREAFDGGLEDAADGIQLAYLASRAGAHDAARELFGRLTLMAPNRADVWSGLAEELALDPGGAAKTAAALERARELAPGEARYRAELALRTRVTREAPAEDHADERYLVPSQAILARRQGVPKGGPPDVADRELYWLRAVVMHPDRRVSQLIQYAREVVIAPRTQDELVEDIPAEGDLTEILRARVHRRDGGVAFPTEEHNEGSRPRIRWPELMPGDTVEVAIRTWTADAVGGRGDPPFYFLDYAGATVTHPVLYNEVVVETLPQSPIYIDVLHGHVDRREDKDENGRHVTRLIWEKPPLIPDEPLAPSLTELVPMAVGSTFKTWADFRAWYAEAVRDFTVPDDEVKRLAAQLTKGKTTREAKLEALFDFVADDIRYVNFVSGEWYLPNRPQQLLARREGDCDDKAILLITLLRAVGIDAEEVMVQTRLTNQPSLLLSKNVAVPVFDHGIAFLPGPNGGTYLDATSPESRLGPLPSMDARAYALKVDSKAAAEIIQLPTGSPEEHGADVSWTLALQPDGTAELTGEERHSGDSAFWMRTSASQPDARAQYVEDSLVSPYLPTVTVDKAIEFKGDLAHGQAWIKYKGHSEGVARAEQGQLVVPLTRGASYASRLAPLLERTLPVSLPPQLAPTHTTRTTRIIAPAGFHFGELPVGGDENGGSFGRAHLDIARDPKDPRSIVVKHVVVFDQSLIPVERYTAFREWLQRVDRLMRKTARLLPNAAPSKGSP
jgi:transglutaminase-like putative cysteine protease/tetratricopeptide (TPR) repeat protein